MYGSIYGDLAGSIYEFEQLKEIKSIDNGGYLSNKSFFSDDTILTVAVCAAIKDDKDYDKYLRKYIIDYMDYKPDFHPYFRSSFSPNLIKWAKSDLEGHSQGNGAMMRISPVGFLFDNEEEVIENSKLATIPSHNSEEAIDSATKIALIIFYLRKGYSKEEVFNMLDINVKYNPFKKFNTTCKETLDNCLYAFYYSNSFIDAMQKTLLMGGDTDTNCAIVGGMAEACYGIDETIIHDVNMKIPHKFVEVLTKD